MLNPSKIADIKESIEKIGIVLGAKERSLKLATSIDMAFSKKSKTMHNCKTLVVFGAHNSFWLPIFVSGNNLYFSFVLDAISCQNAITDDSLTQPSLDKERIVLLNPTRIFILANQKDLDEKSVISAWSSLKISAAKEGAIFVINRSMR